MSALPLVLSSFGLVTGVGLQAASSCAAIRCAIDGFRETGFKGTDGERLLGSEVPLAEPWRGKTKLLKMAARALSETLQQAADVVPEQTPLMLCLAESNRPGRVIDDDNELFFDLCREVGMAFHRESRIFPQGHVSIGAALRQARDLIASRVTDRVLVAATDSLLVARTLSAYLDRDRLLTSQSSNGFIAGEGAGSFLVSGRDDGRDISLVCIGMGSGAESATVESEEPLRADGLVGAIKGALVDAGCTESVLDFKIVDLAGEHYYFKEASLAFSRLDRTKRSEFDVWHPADCVGEMGAGLGVVMIAVLGYAAKKGYSKGSHALMHLGNDDGRRTAFIFRLS